MFTPATIKAIQDIMRQDIGVDGDATRLSQMVWLIYLKILDDEDKALEIRKEKFTPTLPKEYQWRTWAAPLDGITGDKLIDFVNNDLLPGLRELPENGNRRTDLTRMAFQDVYNFMRKGTLLKQVINKINEIDFNASKDRHAFNEIYERLLKSLQSAGNFGEMYTPRAVTQFIVEMVDPKVGESVLDPAVGTGGFLVHALEHMRKQVKSVKDEQKIQQNIHGVEKKPLPFMLLITNMMLHGIEEPVTMRRGNTLEKPIRDYTDADKVDCVVTNPPFGGTEEPGIESNFPREFQTRETADLFLVLIMRLLKKNGRAGIVLPDPTLFGTGMKTRLKEALLQECNLHTIVRLPKSVFAPYTNIATNLLFFTKGEPTKEIWYYEHQLPEGQRAYSMTSPIRSDEFSAIKKWWNNRHEDERAWKVSIVDIQKRNYDLDIKNPRIPKEEKVSAEDLLSRYRSQALRIEGTSSKLKELLRQVLTKTDNYRGDIKTITENIKDFVRIPNGIKIIRDAVLSLALSGGITAQDSKEKVQDLLEEIRNGLDASVDRKSRKKKEKNLNTVKTGPFEIPSSWVWVRGADLFDVIRGVSYGKSDSDVEPRPGYIALLRSHNIQEDGLNLNDLVYVRQERINKVQFIKRGDILVAMSSGSKNLVGKAAQAKEDSAVSYGAFCAVIRPKSGVLIDYLGLFFTTPYYRDAIALGGKGMGINNLTVGALNDMCIPLPPPAEQKRIVKKIEEIMFLVDKLKPLVSVGK